MRTNQHERPDALHSTVSTRAGDVDLVQGPAPAARSSVGRGVAARSFSLLAAGALGLTSLLSPSVAVAQSKIAVIDLQRAIFETEEGLRVQAELKRDFDKRQQELDAKERAVAADRDKLESEDQAGKTPKEALQQKAQKLQRQYAELQAMKVDYDREMQRKQSEKLTPIKQRVLEFVRRIAAQDGYDVVIERAVAHYSRADLDVTDRAIQMYNSGQGADARPAGKGAPPAALPGAVPAAPSKPAAPAPKAPAAPPKK